MELLSGVPGFLDGVLEIAFVVFGRAARDAAKEMHAYVAVHAVVGDRADGMGHCVNRSRDEMIANDDPYGTRIPAPHAIAYLEDGVGVGFRCRLDIGVVALREAFDIVCEAGPDINDFQRSVVRHDLANDRPIEQLDGPACDAEQIGPDVADRAVNAGFCPTVGIAVDDFDAGVDAEDFENIGVCGRTGAEVDAVDGFERSGSLLLR